MGFSKISLATTALTAILALCFMGCEDSTESNNTVGYPSVDTVRFDSVLSGRFTYRFASKQPILLAGHGANKERIGLDLQWEDSLVYGTCGIFGASNRVIVLGHHTNDSVWLYEYEPEVETQADSVVLWRKSYLEFVGTWYRKNESVPLELSLDVTSNIANYFRNKQAK